MVSFTECRLFGEGAAGSPVDGRGECMTFATAGSRGASVLECLQREGFVTVEEPGALVGERART